MSTQPATPPRLAGIADISQAIWQRLACAVEERQRLWCIPGLLTSKLLLGRVDAALRTLLFYTDANSPEAGPIRAPPRHPNAYVDQFDKAVRYEWLAQQCSP